MDFLKLHGGRRHGVNPSPYMPTTGGNLYTHMPTTGGNLYTHTHAYYRG